ncbi:hypothetical protein PR048_006623 [Dryococelus australis]|uniref:Gustatory receptor n=1 Tax=Dryococelus australis TaxID=614101 RepID=A0ABQ9IBJ4_9NEOP|nr:hypothetical protein PR048_006623 [Dryococelus australis]
MFSLSNNCFKNAHSFTKAAISGSPTPSVAVKEDNFYACLEPIATASQMLGLETFRPTIAIQDDGISWPVLERSSRATVYTIIFGTVVIALYIVDVYLSLHEHYSGLSLMLSLSHLISITFATIASLSGIAGMIVNNEYRQKILQIFVRVDLLLLKNVGEYYRTWARSTRLLLIFAFIIVAVATCTELSTFNVSTQGFLLGISLHARDFIAITIVANYASIVLLVRQRIVLLNSHLQDTCLKEGININTHDLRCPPFRTNMEKPTTCTRHGTESAMWTGIYLTEAVVIISACSATVQAAKKTAVIVEDLLLETGIDEEARVQLKEFSVQIDITELEFTAAGLFTLELSLISSMAASVMSHVLVLLQVNPPGTPK